MKKLFLIIFLIPLLGYAQEDKQPIKLETKLKNEEKQKPAVINALQNASRFEDCPPDVFFRLENFEYYTPDGVKKRIEILSRCLQLYPGHARTSVLLSERYMTDNNIDMAIKTITPLLEIEKPIPAVRWLGFRSWLEKGDFQKANKILSGIFLDDDSTIPEDRVALDLIGGAASFHFGMYDQALSYLQAFLAPDGNSRPKPDEVLDDYGILLSERMRRYLLACVLCSAIYCKQSDFKKSSEQIDSFASIFKEDAFQSYQALKYEDRSLANIMIVYDDSAFYPWLKKGDTTDKCRIGFEKDFTSAMQIIFHADVKVPFLFPESEAWLRFCFVKVSEISYYDLSTEQEKIIDRIASLLNAPIIDEFRSDYYFHKRNYLPAVICRLKYDLWFAENYQEMSENDLTLTHITTSIGQYDNKGNLHEYEINDLNLAKRIHQHAMTQFLESKARRNSERVFYNFYISFWHGLLFRNKLFDEICRSTDELLKSHPDDERLLFDFAYALDESGQSELSIQVYRRYLDKTPKSFAGLNNLAIGLKNTGQYEEALHFIRRALEIKPDAKNANNVIHEIQEAIEQRTKKNKLPVQVRSVKASPGHKKIVETQLRPDKAVKAVFDSPNEKLFYGAIVELFPNFLVFPNMACSAIFDYDLMKELLVDERNFGYFLKSRVDFCVVSAINYLPIIAFEVDSSYHDNERMAQKDEIKDLIFSRGGIPLLRFRFPTEVEQDELKQEIAFRIKESGINFIHF